jgi:hypothetical protein
VRHAPLLRKARRPKHLRQVRIQLFSERPLPLHRSTIFRQGLNIMGKSPERAPIRCGCGAWFPHGGLGHADLKLCPSCYRSHLRAVWERSEAISRGIEEHRKFVRLRSRREAQEVRLNWYWQENQAYVSDRPRGARLWPHGCPNEKGWWMSGLEDLHWDYGGSIVSLDAQTGQEIAVSESFPHIVDLHNKSARKLRNRLKREQRRAGLRPVCAKSAHTQL